MVIGFAMFPHTHAHSPEAPLPDPIEHIAEHILLLITDSVLVLPSMVDELWSLHPRMHRVLCFN